MGILKKINNNEKNELIVNISREADIIVLDGKLLQEKDSSINYICKSFQIERKVVNWAGLRDVLSDSYWIKGNLIYVFLINQNMIFRDNLHFRKTLLNIFSGTVEWWAGDVERYVVEGKKKSFNVYLVD